MLRHLPPREGRLEQPRPWLCSGFYQVTFRDTDFGCLLKDLTDWYEQEKGRIGEVSSGVLTLQGAEGQFVFTLYVMEES